MIRILKANKLPTLSTRNWQIILIIMSLSWISVLILFHETALSMVNAWKRSDTYSHGFIVLPVSLYLIWRQRHSVSSLSPSTSFWGFPLLTVLGFIWLLGNISNVIVIQQVALVAMMQGLVLTVLGAHTAYTLLFPLTFLFFAVPIGAFLVPLLTDFTSLFTVAALKITGIPVLLEERFIYIPSGTWEVARECSGIRYLIASVFAGCLFSYLAYNNLFRRLAFILISFVVPIIANSIRAYGIIMLAHLSKNKIATSVDHIIYGWLFFGLLMLILFWLGLKWQEPASNRDSAIGTGPQSSADKNVHVIKNEIVRTYSAPALLLTAVVSIVLLSIAPLYANILIRSYHPSTFIQATAPSVTSPWEPQTLYIGNWMPQFIGTDVDVTKSYTSGGQHVHLYIGYYSNQHQGSELINSENKIAGKNKRMWIHIKKGHTQTVVDEQALRVQETIIRSPLGGKRLVWCWYWVADEFTSSPYYAKLLQAKARLLYSSQKSAVIAISADFADNQSEAADIMQNFLRHCQLLNETLTSFSK